MIRVSLSLSVIFHSQHGTFESKWILSFVAEALMISHIIGPNGQQQRKPIVSCKQSWYSKNNTFCIRMQIKLVKYVQ